MALPNVRAEGETMKHIYIKYNIAINRVQVILMDGNEQKSILTKDGRWLPWTEHTELFDASTKITDVFRYDPRSSPPD